MNLPLHASSLTGALTVFVEDSEFSVVYSASLSLEPQPSSCVEFLDPYVKAYPTILQYGDRSYNLSKRKLECYGLRIIISVCFIIFSSSFK